MQKNTQIKTWQSQFATAVTKPAELLQILQLDTALLPKCHVANALFSLRVPHAFIARMEKSNPRDPLLLQVLPQIDETYTEKDFTPDPLNEKAVNPLSGLLHKYDGRALVTLIGTCGVNCRYCFRREFPYAENNPGKQNFDKIMTYFKEHPDISEVILSGGDPLVASDQKLMQFTDKLAQLPSIKTLRIHTRLPIVLPDRITPTFTSWLKNLPFRTVIVFHCNHPNEIDTSVIRMIKKLKQTDTVLLNQSVLLKNINDSADTLISLSEKLFQAGVLPYYLHMLDKVRGSQHFDVKESVAKKIMREVQAKLPGYLVPRLVREVPGMKSKSIIHF